MDLDRLFLFSERTDSLEGKLVSSVEKVIEEETRIFDETVSITQHNSIPDTTKIPIENKNHWLRIPDVICCFVDMEGSTKLSASIYSKSTASCYRYFTQTAIRIFAEFEAPYIDVKGDGVFALFDRDKVYTALAATVTFKTFVFDYFTPRLEKKHKLKIGGHFGIDQKTLLVRKLGYKRYKDRTDRQNEVWAGKPVNMAAKLASLSTNNRLWVSDRYFNNLKDRKARYSCACKCEEEQGVYLWREEDLENDSKFDFNKAYSLGSNWCTIHGKSFCRDLLKLEVDDY